MPNDPNPGPPGAPQPEPIPPDLLEWARQTFDEEKYLAAVREIEETGGLRFEDFIGEIEERIKRCR